MKNLSAAVVCLLLALTFCSQAFRGYCCADTGIGLSAEITAEESGHECNDGEDDPEKTFPEWKFNQPITGYPVRYTLPCGHRLFAIAPEILSPPPRG